MSKRTYSIPIYCNKEPVRVGPERLDFGFVRWVDRTTGHLHHADLAPPFTEVVFTRQQLEESSLRDWLISQGWTPPPDAAQNNEAKALGLIKREES